VRLEPNRKTGFTLIEVLVVLGIMVILFALLFVPMTASLKMTESGRRQAEMQQRLRVAMEWVKRDLSEEAIYVFPPELLALPGGGYLVNYSTVTFTPAAKDASGQVIKPLRAATDAADNVLATRYAVHTPLSAIRLWPGNGTRPDKYFQVSIGPGPESTFALYRQQGYCIPDKDLGPYPFGSYYDVNGDGSDEFVIDRPLVENAMTPRVGADIPVSRTFCRDNCTSVEGWVEGNANDVNDPTDDTLDVSPGGGWTPQVVYLFDGVQFRPESVIDEQLRPAANYATYWASRGSWLGLFNDGSRWVEDIVWGNGLWINSSEIRPRLVVRRWDVLTSSYSTVVMDTDTLDPALPPPDPDTNNMLGLRWNSRAGAVMVGDYVTSGVDFTSLAADPGLGFWGVTVPAVGAFAPVTAEYPVPPAVITDPRAPVGYVIYPYAASSPAASVPDIKIVRDTLRVWLIAEDATTGQIRRTEYSPVATLDADQIGIYQFSLVYFDDDRQVEIRFNPYWPPSPDLYGLAGTLSALSLQIQYLTRRNFDPASGVDDQIVVSYSSSEAYEVKLSTAEYAPYEPIEPASAIQRPYKEGAQVVFSDRIEVQNLGR